MMQTLKTVGAFLFGLLAIGSFFKLLAFPLFKMFGLTDAAPPVADILINLVVALVCGALGTALLMDISKHQKQRKKSDDDEIKKRDL